MGQVVDTGILIALERRRLPLRALATVAPPEPMSLAAITESELWVGVHRADSPARAAERRRRIERFLAAMPVLPFDSTVARVHAELWADLLSRGQMIGTHDLLIAATAVAHGHAVLTENVADFGRVSRLTVHRPTWSHLGL